MSHLLGISGGGVSTDTITADASETMLKVVEGDDIVWKKKRCAIEIDILEKHQGKDMRPVLRIEEVSPGTKVGSYTLVEKLAFDVCTPEKKPDTTVQASKFTLYDPHPLLHPSRKGTRLNEPDMFHAPPQESRSEIERTPLLPKLGCSQVSFVAKKQKDLFDSLALKEKKSTPQLMIPSLRSLADRHRTCREENDLYLQPVRTPSLPSQPSHLEQVVMMSSAPSQPNAFLRARVSGPGELIQLVPTDDSGWKVIDTHLTALSLTNPEDTIIGKTPSFKSDRPASAPPMGVFSAITHTPQARHYTGDLCGLTDPNPPGDLCGLTDPSPTGDLCGLIEPSPNIAQGAPIITLSQSQSLSENLRSVSVTKQNSQMEVVTVQITTTEKPMEPLKFPTDESVVGIIPGVLLPEQTAYGKRPKISIEELQKPVTKPGFGDSSSEEEQEEEDEVGALPKKESTLGTEAEGSYFADSEMSATPTTAKNQKFDFVKRLFTCGACRSKKKHQLQFSEKETSEISSRSGKTNKSSRRSSQMSDPSERSESTQHDLSERSAKAQLSGATSTHNFFRPLDFIGLTFTCPPSKFQ